MPDLVGFGRNWSELGLILISGKFGRNRSELVGFGWIGRIWSWSDLVRFGRIWSDLVGVASGRGAEMPHLFRPMLRW